MNERLTGHELLEQTYEKLAERHAHQDVTFPSTVWAEIADDSDWHRTRKGYMKYESARLFQLNGKGWAIAQGEAGGGYPARPYGSDILALEFVLQISGRKARLKSDEQIQRELSTLIERSTYFENSLMFTTSDGRLMVNDHGRFGMRMKALLQPRFQEFIAQQPEYDQSVVLVSTMQNPTTRPLLYTPECVDFLADSIEHVLQ